MAAAYLATQVPVPLVTSGFIDLAAAENATGASGATVTRTFAQGNTTTVPSKLNRNAAAQQLLGRYGGGVNGVAYGCDVSIGTGLAVNIAQGHYIADGGVVNVPSGSTLSGLPASQAMVFIWGKADGAFTYATTTAVPTGGVVLLGIATTSGSAVTAVDETGVMKLLGGLPIRQTADPGMPGDTPPATVAFITRTLDGDWLWDGQDYSRLVRQLAHNSLSVPSGKSELVPAGRQVAVWGTFDVDGTLDVYGDMLVLE